MPELIDTTQKPERVLLIGVRSDRVTREESESLLKELAGLAKSLGLEIAGSLAVHLRQRTANLLFGSGKADEIFAAAQAEHADSIIFDHALSPVQQRNWETLTSLSVYDRSELIIRIFASRAHTREAQLQVELARLQFSLPRLAHSYTELSQQRGGRYGSKGKGEQKIELDRREIEKRIHELKEELKEVRTARDVRNKRRERQTIPRAAVVGYTNAGKSSLLNALTLADVHVEDRLFATLDPTTRRIALSGGSPLLLTDTVGFVRNLPHGLVEAFKATLEEAADADLLVHVVDAADSEAALHMATTLKVLTEIGAAELPSIVVLNKIDLVPPESRATILAGFEGAIPVSALHGEGLESLRSAIEEKLTAKDEEVLLRLPHTEYSQVTLLYRQATVLEERHEDDATVVRCRLPARIRDRFAPFIV